MTVLAIGADPELFVRDKHTKEMRSAIGILGGTKAKPRPVHKGAIQEDNVLAEFNINPAHTEEEFYVNIRRVMHRVAEDLDEHGLEPYVCASHVYTKPYLKSLGSSAMQFGCDKDFNAWTGEENPKPSPYTCLRSAGGHLHVSYVAPNTERSYNIVKAYEVFEGLPTLFVDHDTQRRELYGKSGACRIKPYGVEIRSPSNHWLKDESSIKGAYHAAVFAESMADQIDDLLESVGYTAQYIQDVINGSMLKDAEQIMKRLSIA